MQTCINENVFLLLFIRKVHKGTISGYKFIVLKFAQSMNAKIDEDRFLPSRYIEEIDLEHFLLQC